MVTIQFIPYAKLEGLSSLGRIRKLLTVAKQDKIVLLQGRLRKEEEAELIKVTMEEINREFKGIELAVINPTSTTLSGMQKLRNGFANMFLGNRVGMTVIGPANIVKQIKKDPDKIALFTKESKRKSKGKRR
ncbi:DUF2073 domain-containing protein [Candidatus Woesearchaeota archaeon]|nr:DUF2073 domain-containing protein [Candidatus Woesearchaeota archaeon]